MASDVAVAVRGCGLAPSESRGASPMTLQSKDEAVAGCRGSQGDVALVATLVATLQSGCRL